MPAEVIREQESGYYMLMSETAVPPGFASVAEAESKKVFGRHCIHGRDDEGCNPDRGCGGGGGSGGGGSGYAQDSLRPGDSPASSPGSAIMAMASYTLNLFNPGLTITDTPVQYSVPFGHPAALQLTYNERSTVIEDEPNHSHFGARWSHDYLGYIDLTGSGTPSSQLKLVSGDGHFFAYANYNSTTQTYSSRYGDLPRVQYVPEESGYQAIYADGSIEQFYQPDGPTPTRYFLTRRRDPQGMSVTLNYDPGTLRLTSVVDSLGQATTFSYVPEPGDPFPADTYRIRKATDPFGRAARFHYTPAGGFGRSSTAWASSRSFTMRLAISSTG